jgi:hypothetical protein
VRRIEDFQYLFICSFVSDCETLTVGRNGLVLVILSDDIDGGTLSATIQPEYNLSTEQKPLIPLACAMEVQILSPAIRATEKRPS